MMNKENKLKLFDTKPDKHFFAQMAFGTAFTYLTSGVFLSGLAILIGAGDVLVSYISVISNSCGVLILVFAAFLERFRSRKRLTIGLTLLTKLATLFIVTIPAFVPTGIRVAVFIPAVIAAFTLQAQTTVALNNWMIAFIHEERRGRYISSRQTLALIVTVFLSLTSGFFMDAMQGKYAGFVILFFVAFLMGVVEIAILFCTPDSIAYVSQNEKCSFRDIVKIPLKNKPFMCFAIYIAVFYLLLHISDSFTMVYMMRYLELPYRTVTVMYMLISLPQVVLLGVWGRISDRRGHNFVLMASIWFFAGETLFMVFSSPRSYHIFIPIAFLMASVANAGFIVSVFNRRYELMPRNSRIIYDNFYSAAIGSSFILGPMVGGVIKNLLETSVVMTKSFPFANIRLLYIISTAGILLLQTVYSYLQRKSAQSQYIQCERGTCCVKD